MNTRCHFLISMLSIFGMLSSVITLGDDPNSTSPNEHLIQFNRDIRPILSDNCFLCHGPNEETREADLRLDVAEDALANRGDYFAILAGKPEKSEVWSRISSNDADELMPPPESHKQLTEGEKELLRRWIAAGADWQGHWAFIAPKRPSLQKNAGEEASNPIDWFVSQRLASEGLAPSAEADRRTLARRLSFDLLGLPASSDEVDAFVASTDPHAYESLVDRLLASPHYGERMAQFWLDLVRYADTNGIHGDNPRIHSPYRDYVIQAFNENMPFDQFTREQLAGDLLPGASNWQKIASGYNRLNMTTREGGAQPKEYMAKYAADRVRNAASVWLGITMGCCECHDHKFDPFTTREFYEFEAFFADIKETAVGVQEPSFLPVGEAGEQCRQLEEELAELEKQLNTQTRELSIAQAEWEGSIQLDNTGWVVLRPQEVISIQQSALQILDDGSVLSKGVFNPPSDTYVINAKTKLPNITALRLTVLRDPSLPQGGPGRAADGSFVLSEIELRIGTERIPLDSATASYSHEDWDISGAIDGDQLTGWAVSGEIDQDNSAIFRTSVNNAGRGETLLTITLIQNQRTSHTLGRFQLSVTDAADPPHADQRTKLPLKVADILRIDPPLRTESQRDAVAAYFRGISPQLAQVRAQVNDLRQKIDQINRKSTVISTVSIEPREMRVLPKGDWLNESGDVISPGVPGCFPDLGVSGRRATRLDLANWLIRKDNPLVARVLVNRLWRLMFGRGIVTSSDDFGAQGTWPSHPALLDWLATELIDSGWDIKHMLRLMATSHTYRQSSLASAELLQRDPGNRWLARQGRFRLDAEMIRDNALAVSGMLSSEIGGPSVKPYQPVGYWQHLNFPRRVYQQDAGVNLYRRGLYTHWQRTFLHPSLAAFDAPTREECTAKRSRSNTPLQALVLLNDPTYVEAARVLAEHMIHAGADDPRQTIRYAYRQIFARAATDSELFSLTQYYQEQQQLYEADKPAATELIGIGEWPVPEDIEAVKLAAWTSVARVLLNLHETITRY